jgi:uncharacterized LabA/DUF88 family protein
MPMSTRTLVMIDVPNIDVSSRQHHGTDFDPEEIILKVGGWRSISEVRAYADATSLPDPVRQRLERHGVTLVHVTCRKDDGMGYTDVDGAIAADLVEIAATRRDVHRIVLATGDGDFRFACAKARKYGKTIAVAAVPESLSRVLSAMVDEVIPLQGRPRAESRNRTMPSATPTLVAGR